MAATNAMCEPGGSKKLIAIVSHGIRCCCYPCEELPNITLTPHILILESIFVKTYRVHCMYTASAGGGSAVCKIWTLTTAPKNLTTYMCVYLREH